MRLQLHPCAIEHFSGWHAAMDIAGLFGLSSLPVYYFKKRLNSDSRSNSKLPEQIA